MVTKYPRAVCQSLAADADASDLQQTQQPETYLCRMFPTSQNHEQTPFTPVANRVWGSHESTSYCALCKWTLPDGMSFCAPVAFSFHPRSGTSAGSPPRSLKPTLQISALCDRARPCGGANRRRYLIEVALRRSWGRRPSCPSAVRGPRLSSPTLRSTKQNRTVSPNKCMLTIRTVYGAKDQ